MRRSAPKSRAMIDNAAWKSARPVLSVLIPFFRDDPGVLLEALSDEAQSLAGTIEIVVMDDGSGDAALADRISDQIMASRLPARFIRLKKNEGRSRGRNRLTASARGGSFLFLDSDMLPDDRRFLQRWADLVAHQDPAVAFGGFSLLQASHDRAYAVHRAMSLRSECIPYQERARQPEKYVYTSNLLVRRDVFEAEAFDAEFSGWGWEDVEWAMRVARRFRVIHLDNPATHLGLESTDRLAGKYEQSVANFARVVDRHPDFVSQYPSYRVARLLKGAPGVRQWRSLFKHAALNELLPVSTRALSLRLYRAALYAEAV